MPPQKTQITCPRCRQPVVALVEQLFDVTADPGAKQRLLGGVSNVAVCRNCGFSGPLATPIVYHDAEKELLLTYFPPELNLSVNDQERLVGPLITQITNRLPPEKRKAYLLRPQNFLTYQSLIERILGADGITPEMIKAQQQKVALVERLFSAQSAETRAEIIRQESALIDGEFFALFSRLAEGILASGQEQAAALVQEIEQQLLSESEYGRKMVAQSNEIQEAIRTLQAAGRQLDRKKLLEILIDAPNDDRLHALVSLTRPALDYLFFQALSERIEAQKGEERKKLETLREKLLEITRQIDVRLEEEYRRAATLLETILQAENIEQATLEHLGEMGEFFVQAVNQAVQAAQQARDEGRLEKLQRLVAVLQRVSKPPEVELLEELLSAPDETTLHQLLEKNADKIDSEFTSMIANLLARTEEEAGQKPSAEEEELIARLRTVYRAALKIAMKQNL
jgi:hypothetical protein